ncbi:MAG: RNA-binding domain-containing protein [Bacteroidota bacterium]
MPQASPLVEQLVERLQDKEQLDLEFKECRDALSHSVWETVSAFANTQGGWLLLGVNNEGVPLGVRNPERRVQELFDLGRNRNKISAEAWRETDISIEPLNDLRLIVVRVPAVPRTKRPVYINGNPMTGTFVRRQGGDYHCSEDEVRRMFREASAEAIDSTVLSEFKLDSLNSDAVARYRQRLQNRNPEHEFNNYPLERFLSALGATDPTSQHPTIAGLLNFGTELAIRRWRKRHLIDYRSNAEKISDTTWVDRVTWEGNIFDAFFKIYPKLTEGIPIPHRIEAGERVEETPTHIALREALVNLLVHADYTESDASLISKSPEGYYLRNPGSSRVSSQDLLTGNRSEPRNPTLLFMFRLVGLAEEAGTGLPRIIRAWRSLGFKLPNVEVGTERYEFSLVLRNAHLFSDEDREFLLKLGTSLDEAEQLALVCAKHERRVDNERLRGLLALHPADATRVLTGLRDRGLLKKESDRRGAFYHIPGACVEAETTPTLFQAENLRDVDKHSKDARESLRVEHELLREIKKDLREKLSRNEKRQLITKSILRLCSIRSFGNKELAKVFRMTPTNLVTGYLRQMLDGGQLEWTGRSKRDRNGKYQTAQSKARPTEA